MPQRNRKSLKKQLQSMCFHFREGSFSTQDTRKRILSQIADDLRRLGYRNMQQTSLKQKHVWALVNDWKERELSLSTIKNRMSAVRWWARHAGCRDSVAATNEHYGIEKRTYVAKNSRATELNSEKLSRVSDPYVKLSLKLQEQFGLRREEAMKFQIRYADQTDHIRLKSSWCKGGRPRKIPVRNESQRALLDEIRTFTGGGSKVSLIPAELKYVDQLHKYEYQTQLAGLEKMHGLRHAYAQTRYLELTGWKCPVQGGPHRQDMNPEDRDIDERARLIIAEELGHGREEITTVYLGR